MVVLDINMELFIDTLDTALLASGIKGFPAELITNEAKERFQRYLADTGNGEVISNNLLVSLAEIVIILRNNYIDQENEAFIIEDLHKLLTKYSDNNPYM